MPAYYNDGTQIEPSDGMVYKPYNDDLWWIWHQKAWCSGATPDLPGNYITVLNDLNSRPAGYYQGKSDRKKKDKKDKDKDSKGGGQASGSRSQKKGAAAHRRRR